MPWEPTIVEQFQFNHHEADESRFYGPYITLLTTLFPPTDHYQVTPRCNSPGSSTSIDFTITYGLSGTVQIPVLFLQIKPYAHLDDLAKRERADNWMRDRFRELFSLDFLPKLYGISAMGTRVAVYEYREETNRITPPSIPRDPDTIDDVAPRERWNSDLLGPDGERLFRLIAREANVELANIALYAPDTDRNFRIDFSR
jgi:hypothetical protein